jgi:4-hydroxy-tetrahydrodipicolinate synthase
MAAVGAKYARSDAKAWARETLKDVFVTTTMPFHEDLSIDEHGLRSNVEQILRMRRIGGVYVGSIYQEFPTLTLGERMRVADVVLDQVQGRVPVMVGVTATSIADVVALGEHADEAGADLLMVWPPTFGERTADGVVEFYRRVAGSLDLGICLYASGLSELGFQLTIPMIECLSELDTVCALKEASWNIGTYLQTLQRVGSRIVVSAPALEFWLPGRMVMGDALAHPVILGSSKPLYLETESASVISDMLDAFDAGETEATREHFLRGLGVGRALVGARLDQGSHSVAFTKAVTELVGMAGGPVRPPSSPPQADAVRAAAEILRGAGVIA